MNHFLNVSILCIIIIAITSSIVVSSVDRNNNDKGHSFAIATTTLAYIGIGLYSGSILNANQLVMSMILIAIGIIVLSYVTYDELRNSNHKERNLSLAAFSISLITVTLLCSGYILEIPQVFSSISNKNNLPVEQPSWTSGGYNK